MKKYVKPALMALELEADSVLCASGCTDYNKNDAIVQLIMSWYDESLWSNLFAVADNCSEVPDDEFEEYCKFQGANIVFIS